MKLVCKMICIENSPQYMAPVRNWYSIQKMMYQSSDVKWIVLVLIQSPGCASKLLITYMYFVFYSTVAGVTGAFSNLRPWSARIPSSCTVPPPKVNLTSNQHLQPPHLAMCPSETSIVIPSSHSQRELRERRDCNQSSTNMKLFVPPRAFYNLGSTVRPSCLFEL